MTGPEPAPAPTPAPLSQERQDLLESLQTQRHFLTVTVANLTDEQARLTPTVSALSLGGLIKHVSLTEQSWYAFATGTPEAMAGDPQEWMQALVMGPQETLADLLARYEQIAARTDELAATADLDVAYPLPPAPWFAPGATRSVRRVLMHIVAETAQHCGHADIIRESIDGQKTMG